MKLSRFWVLLCVGPDTYFRVPLPFMRESDSLRGKTTRTQRALK
jgi:hypothetical protein